ncbi:MAG: ATP-dependent helicase HrpB [Acidobacteria bacterium]|nr:ATP-dependent helicase HrpB [Acidobacteriota bacterium]
MLILPIDSLIPKIIATLRVSPNLILEAPPGAGKTTRVPPALLNAKLAGEREVWVLEPRRLAARMAARRVAEELGERAGETVGYQVRFDEVAGPRTRLRFLTEGVLTRRLLSDPQLKKTGIVILDEFHERHLQADLALALLRRLQMTIRPDLKLVVMSATMDAAPVADYLDHAPVLRSEGKLYDVQVEHLARPDNRPLAEQVEAAVRRLISEKGDGDILVLLPGAAEIRRAQSACGPLTAKHEMLLFPLHGDLPAAEQDRAVQPGPRRKVILSTNVAESSITIEGVAAVIDSGLARIAGHSPWSGLPELNTSRISKASAIQRAGRAGRTQPGNCLRLYTLQDFNARPDHETAEIHRLDLSEAALELHAAGINDLSSFDWFEAPPQRAVDATDTLLRRLGAIDKGGEVTVTGREMLRFPLHPRQSRMLVEARSRGVGEQACVIAALIGEREILSPDTFKDERQRTASTGPSDLLDRLDLFEQAMRANLSGAGLRTHGLDHGAVLAVERVRNQLLRLAGRESREVGVERDLLISILSGYPDRVAKRRSMRDNLDLLLSGGGSALLSRTSVVRQAEFMVAVDADVRNDPAAGRQTGAIVRMASAIEPEWLLDLFSDNLSEKIEAKWNDHAERVEVTRMLLYDQLIIDRRIAKDDVGEDVTRVLIEHALDAGWQRFVDPEALTRFLARVELVARTFPEENIPCLTDEDAREALKALAQGLRSFAELKNAGSGLIEILRQKLGRERSRLLSQMAPDQVAIAGRRQVKVHYQQGMQPWIASRMQDFFGMKEGPKIAGGRVSLILHLLAPNQRPVQVTTDLAGFWQRTYPQVRRELSRKYPRHRWPDNPMEFRHD